MNQYSRATCPTAIEIQVNTFCARLKAVLETNLLGIYLHGSLAMGCFNPDRSDIDLLVVTNRAMSIETKRQIIQLLLHSSMAPDPIEISFLLEQQVHSFQHPLPFDLHYSEAWRERYQRELANGSWRKWNDTIRTDVDLAAHFTIVLNRGICLLGKPVKEVFPPVPTRYYIASIVGDFADARDARSTKPFYFILNACRVYAYLLDGSIYSKDEGGAWGLLTLPGEYHNVIAQALDTYRGSRNDELFDLAALDRFAAYMDERIKILLETKEQQLL
jgi:predicted nucleotidyltransferase